MKPQIPPAQGSASAAQITAWIILLALVTTLSLRGWGTFQVGVYQDDAVYVLLARSIAFGDHYGLTNEPGPPRPSKFPFGLPLVLAPLVRAFPDDPLVCTLVSLGATLVNISLLFWGWPLLGPGASRWWGLGSAWLYGVTPRVMGQTRAVLSEPLFTLFLLVALLLTEARLRHGGARRWLSPALGVVLMLAVCTRWIGVVVCLAVLARFALAARSQCLRWFAGMLGGALGALTLVLLLTPIDLQQVTPGQYLRSRLDRLQLQSEKRDATEHSRKTPADYVTNEVRRVILAVGGGTREREIAQRLGLSWLPTMFSTAITALVAFGAWRGFLTARLAPSVVLFEALYAGALAWWPFVTDRHLYPLLPFLPVQLLIAVHALARRVEKLRSPTTRPFASAAVVTTCGLLIVFSLSKSVRVEDSRAMTGDLRLVPGWLARHTPADAVVMAQAPEVTFLYAQRATVPHPTSQDRAEIERSLTDGGVDYLLLEPKLRWGPAEGRPYSLYVQETLSPIVAELAAQGRLTLVHTAAADPLVRVYRVEPRPR